MMREMAKMRSGMRQRDIAESKHLLWELVTHEPTVLQCFGVVEATCMAQGLFCKIDGERCGDDFQRFLDAHYLPFCRQVRPSFLLLLFPPVIKNISLIAAPLPRRPSARSSRTGSCRGWCAASRARGAATRSRRF